MVELEQGLGRLPEDPAVAPVPLPDIVARADRRRRRRRQGQGVTVAIGLVAAALALPTLLPDRDQVVDTAGSGQVAGTAPPLRTAAKVVAEGDLEGGHWRLFARPTDDGMCLDLDYRDRTSTECFFEVTALTAIDGGLTTGLDATFFRGVIRKDASQVRIESSGGGPLDLPPAGIDAGFDVHFFVSPVSPDSTFVKAVAIDSLGGTIGALQIGSAVEPTGPALGAPRSPPSVGVPVPTSIVADPDGSVSSPPMTSPPQGVVPTLPGNSDLPSCPPDQVTVTVTAGKPVYAVGETVTAASTLQNNSSTACLVPARVRFSVEDLAGNDVSGFAYTADYALPVRAEPGQSFPGSLTWDQTDCGGFTCTQVPPGTYVAVGRWTEGGSFRAQASFQVA